MARKSRIQKVMNKYIDEVLSAINNNSIIDATRSLPGLPPRDRVRDVLSKPPFNILDRSFRVILVEDLGGYKIYIQTPGEKTDFDFFVWRAVFQGSTLKDLKIPSHDDLGKMFLDLKRRSPTLNEYLIDAAIRLIRDRVPTTNIINKYFTGLSRGLIKEVKKFLLTLKWIALQEDVNYPPPKYLGSLYTLSVYALLEVFGDLSIIRRIVRFGGV